MGSELVARPVNQGKRGCWSDFGVGGVSIDAGKLAILPAKVVVDPLVRYIGYGQP